MAIGTRAAEVHPIINEIMPRNDALSERRFLDEDWTKQGWIELYNPSDAPVRLLGYCLLGGPATAQRWFLPNIVLGGHDFLRVWTSGKDRNDPRGELHTSFTLMETPDLILARSRSDDALDRLQQITVPANISYGRYPDGASAWYFYTESTPAAHNTGENKKPFVVDRRHVSLTVGMRYPLTVTPREETVAWSSDNPLVWAEQSGDLLALQDAQGQEARATVTASSPDGAYADSCQVTIVDWVANLSELNVVETPYASYILGTEGENLYYTIDRDLYVTSDGFETSRFLSTLPEEMDIPKMLITPFGYFVQCDRTVFASLDLTAWTPSVTMNMRGLNHALAYYWESESQTGYVYVGEYSSDHSERHQVRRGIFPAGGEPTWETVLDFASINEWQGDPSIFDAARHVHTVAVDPYTGHVWVGTGDTDVHSKLFYSDDNGATFQLVAMGSQAFRTLSIWFTERYVYWSMDTYDDQACWRMPRTQFEQGGFWPVLTPELRSGTTKLGVRYVVTADGADGRFPVSVGEIYEERRVRRLDGTHRVRAVDDPEYDYKEKVVELRNGSLWYHLWVRDEQGEPILILGQAAEGAQRDYRGRIFGLKERPGGRVDVQELLSISSDQPDTYDSHTMYVQLEPQAQDAQGYIYFKGRATGHKSYKAKLTWADNPPIP